MSSSRCVESRGDVETYLAKLKYAIRTNNVTIAFQENRIVDDNRPIEFTNKFTISDLFPDENPVVVLKSELLKLECSNYMYSERDIRFTNKSPMYVFAMYYEIKLKYVYIKIRVELLRKFGNNYVFVMSFHYSDRGLSKEDFPYL